MPTRQFDGPNLEAALAAVRAELGPNVKILGADKVRKGGVAGFFSKERVEVTVEVSDDVDAVEAVSAPVSLLDLADSISDAEHGLTAVTSASVIDDRTSFAAVLGRITAEGEQAIAAQTAIDPPPTAEFSFAPIPELEFTPQLELAPDPEPESLPVLLSQPDILAPFAALAARGQEPNSLQWDTGTVPDSSAFEVAAVEVEAEDEVEELELEVAPSTELAVPAYASDLERLGMPGALVPAHAGGDLFGALVSQLELLPVVPTLPHARGSVLVVVGPASGAVEVARDLALEVRTHPRDVIVLTADSDVEDLEDQRRSWRRRLDPTVVVVDAAIAMSDRFWARDMIATLEPSSVWGVVDGGRKLEDLASWYDMVGGVDALAVTGVHETMTPASVLHLGLPVALLDGEPASPELWAELLLDRLAA